MGYHGRPIGMPPVFVHEISKYEDAVNNRTSLGILLS